MFIVSFLPWKPLVNEIQSLRISVGPFIFSEPSLLSLVHGLSVPNHAKGLKYCLSSMLVIDYIIF